MANIGVCYGMQGDALPSPQTVVTLCKGIGFRSMRLYAPNQGAFEALSGKNIKLMLGVEDPTEISRLASSKDYADKWVNDNVRKYIDKIEFNYIVVGNEVNQLNYATQKKIHPAMQMLHTSITKGGLKIGVSTAIGTGALQEWSRPSQGSFRADILSSLLGDVIPFLKENATPLLVNVHPYLSHIHSQNRCLDYALFTATHPVVHDGLYDYKNLFDAILDAVYSALEKFGCDSLKIVVSESGWPTDGGTDTTIENAKIYNTELNHHVNEGTPRKPGTPIETYVRAMFDENTRTDPEYERHWGLFTADGTAKYTIT